MKVINIASRKSASRGLDYYQKKRITSYKKIDDFRYEGKAKGSNNAHYNVFLDIEHPRKSTCDCPHAKDRKIICKHIVALYFTVFPNEAETFLAVVEEEQNAYEKYEQILYNKTIDYIKSMSKSELQDSLIEILNIAPDWIYDRFVRDHIGY